MFPSAQIYNLRQTTGQKFPEPEVLSLCDGLFKVNGLHPSPGATVTN